MARFVNLRSGRKLLTATHNFCLYRFTTKNFLNSRKALRALNERLKREQQNPEQQDGENWPTIDDDRKENEEIAEETNQTRDDTQDFDNDTIDVLSKKGKDEQ